MKKIISLALVVLMALSILSGCAKVIDEPKKPAVSGIAALENCKTFGDVLALEGMENEQTAICATYYIFAFELDGTWYRTIAELNDENSEGLWDLDYDDEEYEQKRNELIAPLEIIRKENLSDTALSQAELNALVGKTGQDLLDDGWYNVGWNLDTMEFWMNKGAFAYTVIMEGEIENPNDFDDAGIPPLVVKSVTCTGIGDATNIELDDGGVLV